MQATNLPLIGWRETLSLPDLGIPQIKVKIDTGAATSSIHAYDVQIFERAGKEIVRFEIHPIQHSKAEAKQVEIELLEHRLVRSSTGHATDRPVICTMAEIGGFRWPIELTLASRDSMGFRMLLGRQALRDHFWVDSAGSFLLSHPPKIRRKKKKKKRPRHPDGGSS
ncbi:ATP-dependent zinc protease [Planctomycetales bacterium 10988]|nr:ATP-dependent zinc protease [Planctomycetales bacterium 10988]